MVQERGGARSSEHTPEADGSEDAVCALHSGSTVNAKGVVHTHRRYTSGPAHLRVDLRLRERRRPLVHRPTWPGQPRPQSISHSLMGQSLSRRPTHRDVRGAPRASKPGAVLGRWIEKHKVSLFYTGSATAIRAFMKSGARCPITTTLGSFARSPFLGTVATINPSKLDLVSGR